MTAILASILTFDLFLHPDRSITFDGRVHITTISMYHDLLAQKQFPILWVDTWGNYGHPLGLISYQVTSYLGGLLQFVLGSPTLTYNTLFWLATFASGTLMYLWLRQHVGDKAAILGEIIFLFTPYHLQNIYVRGALPEYVGSVFILLILLGLSLVLRQGKIWGHLCVSLGVAFLALTNLMMLVTGLVLSGLYVLFLIWTQRITFKTLVFVGVSGFLGVLLASYYLFPLMYELKYFQYGLTQDKLRAGEFLSVSALLSSFAPYFGASHPGPPGVSLRLGLIEAFTLVVGIVGLILEKIKQHKNISVWVMIILGLILLTLPISTSLYEHVSLFNNLQYPWRFLSVICIAISFLAALLFEEQGNQKLFYVAVIAVFLLSIPTAYGKNYLITPPNEYRFTMTNLHTKNMAPIWAGESAEYLPHPEKIAIIEGTGTVSNVKLSNSFREFDLNAKTPVRLIDYTFFFPGWKVYVDSQETNIEFQDINYRGVITYKVPQGKHHVIVKFIETRDRKLGWVLSGGAIVLLSAWFCFLFRISCIKNIPRVK